MASFHDYQESLGESTSTSASFTSKVSSSTTLTSGVTYLIIWSCELQNNNTGGQPEARLRDHTGSATLQRNRWTPKDATDYVFSGNVATFTAASTATNEFRIEYNRTAAGTTAIRNARILIIALDSSDFATSSTSTSTSNSGSFQDKCTLSVNGATAGDYLFLAGSTSNDNNPDIEIRGLRTDASTAVNVASGLSLPNGFGTSYTAIWVETLTGANVSAKLQYRSLDGNNVGIGAAYLVAIRIASLGDSYAYTFDGGDDAGTDTVATDSETLSGDGVDTVGGDVIVIAAINYKGSSSTISSQAEFREGSTTMITSFHEDRGVTNGDDVCGIIGYRSTSANSTETWKWRRLSETSSATTTVNYAAIAVLGLTAGSTDYDGAANDGTITISPKVATLLVDANLDAADGAITINGQPATILADTSAYLDATKGTLTFTGQPATLLLDQNLDAADGAIVINGQAAVIETGQDAIVDATAGSIVINGQPATISTDLVVTATRGQIVINGQVPVLVVDANLAASAGAIAISAKPATLFITTDAISEAGSRRLGFTGQAGWIYTEDNGGSVTIVDPPEDRGGRNIRELVNEVDPDWGVGSEYPVIYRFGSELQGRERAFEKRRREYDWAS